MRVQFTKMHGLGNDFVVIDAVSQHVSLRSSQIQKLADRNTGIGFDQLLLIEPPSRPDADFDYRIFNSDGGEVEHCGNGARCFAKFVTDRELTTKPVIGVPCGGKVPYDSLLSIAQLPPGVPAATVGVDRGDNAGYLAVQMLALSNANYAAALEQNKLDQIERVKAQDREVNGGA